MRFLIVSGPTREPLDPVRYLSNYSTGTMGKHLAAAAKARRHRVDWVRCPDDAETARDLLKELGRRLPKCDILVMAAAVCDARPAAVSAKKIKKEGLAAIRLVKNPDILVELSKKRKKGQVFVGFALESENRLQNAWKKLSSKGLQLILLQEVTDKEKPFGEKSVNAWLLDSGGSVLPLPRASKARIARVLIRRAEDVFSGG